MFIFVDTPDDVVALAHEQAGYRYIFKHSTTCPRSILAHRDIKKVFVQYPGLPVVYINVRKQRPLSNRVEKYFNITHESPQLIRMTTNTVQEVKNHRDVTARYVIDLLQEEDANKSELPPSVGR